MSSNPLLCPKGLAKGVVVENLWDIERSPTEGRRSGERTVESVWWRAEVLETGQEGGYTTANVKYDAMGGFKSQIARLYVFPSHVQPVGEKDMTQLRWRFFESSGNISYDLCNEDNDLIGEENGSHLKHNSRITLMQRQMNDLTGRIEHVERVTLLEQGANSQVSAAIRTDHTRMEVLLAMLRHKLAITAQKTLPSFRSRDGDHDTSPLFDLSCAGSMRSFIDCTVGEFEALCESISKQSCAVEFRADKRPFVPSPGCLKTSLSVAEISFESLADLCKAIGIAHHADRLAIAWKKKVSLSKVCSNDVSIRVCGTFLCDTERDDTTSMILLCQGLSQSMSTHHKTSVLSRMDGELDPRTVWYKKPLHHESISISRVLRTVFPKGEDQRNPSMSSTREEALLLAKLSSEVGSFALRWKPLSTLNPKIWTRKISNQTELFGSLEIEVPYLLIRGDTAVNELEKVLTNNLMHGLMN